MDYQGFTVEQRNKILILTSVLAVLVIALASYAAYRMAQSIAYGPDDRALIETLGTAKLQGDPGIAAATRSRSIEAFAHGRAISSSLTLGYLAVGSGIALMWLGFALSVLGADGSFQLQAQSEDQSIRFGGTTPGILALGFGAGLIAIGATRSFDLDFEPMVIKPPSPSAPKTPKSDGSKPAAEPAPSVPGRNPGQVGGSSPKVPRTPGKKLTDAERAELDAAGGGTQ